ncbi:MAG: glycosyltransferase involved in cell wall biosynthesis [Cellvibrionaceae bacterium]|jgi:glycosyltransferase involved in cell wall biosynthesis
MKSIIDIVVPTYNRGDLILETVESLLATDHTDISIWIIDQSADDLTEKTISPLLTDNRLNYVHSVKKGSNLARNLGISLGQAPIVAFTDDDCIVDTQWIGTTLEAFEQAKVDAVFGRIIDQSIGLPGEQITDGLKIAVKDDPVRKLFHGNRFKLDFGHGANMAFRRCVLDSIFGFDPLLGNGGPLRSWPEKDIGYRILAKNGMILYEPDMIIYHKQWRSWSGIKVTQRNYGFGAGAIGARYLKNGDWGGIYLMFEWMVDQGVRQVISGILKWRSWQKISAGLIQIFYPIPGFFEGLKHPVWPNPKSLPLSVHKQSDTLKTE